MQNPLTKKKEIKVYNPAKGVYSFKIVFVNVIMVAVAGTEDKEKPEWLLIDTGLKGFSKRIKRVAEKHFGADNPPRAIILTHGHFDHVGSLKKLLEDWDVPVFCHRLELPYLTGKSSYPPQDPTVDNGMMAMLSRIYPTGPIDLGNKVLPLPADGTVPFLDGWKWYHVPGHSPGQVALFREKDRTLISADAFVTTDQESAYSVITQRRKINGPPAYFTIDWQAAEASVFLLEKLRAHVVVSGHGRPMEGSKMRKQLRMLAHHFQEKAMPKHGRYVNQPVIADERGVVDVPPPVLDALPRVLAGVALASMAAATTYMLVSKRLERRSRNNNDSDDEPGKRALRSRETESSPKRKQAKRSGAGTSSAAATRKSSSAKKSGKKTTKSKTKKED
jgi:glyoxylase-like metal-dependent hydrolase (beta-lactamase superfamily II)